VLRPQRLKCADGDAVSLTPQTDPTTESATNTMTIEQRLERIEQFTLLAAKDVLTTDDVAAYTGLSKGYLYQLVSRRGIPHYKSEGGKYTYFKKSEINAWLLAHRVASKAENEAAAVAYVVNNPTNKRKGGAK